MPSSVSVLKPESSTVVDDLRTYANQIESGERLATTVLLIFRDRVGSTITTTYAGEGLDVSHQMGICQYAAGMLYDQAKANDDG